MRNLMEDIVKQGLLEIEDVVNRCKSVKDQFSYIYNSIVHDQYPAVPPAMGTVDKLCKLPERPGVYFAWNSERVVYVGQSKCLYSRVTTAHECLEERQRVSWIIFDIDELNYAEAYYIGICRPSRNFGRYKRFKKAIQEYGDLEKIGTVLPN